ncbi:hypothetical protein QUB32_28165, partial [Microcoleus sp. AT8-A4]
RPSVLDGRDAHPTITIKIVSYLIRDPKRDFTLVVSCILYACCSAFKKAHLHIRSEKPSILPPLRLSPPPPFSPSPRAPAITIGSSLFSRSCGLRSRWRNIN